MKGLLINFAYGRESAKDRNFLLKEINRIARKSGLEGFLKKRVGDDYAEEVLSVLRLKMFSTVNKIENKDFISLSYLRKVIYSCMVDTLNGDFKAPTVSMEELNYKDEEGSVVSFEDNIAFKEDPDLKVVAQSLLEHVYGMLKEEDIKVMCYYLCKELYSEEIDLQGMTKTNLYKRWERLKRKLAENLPYTPTEEEFREFVERFVSEVCEKRGYLSNKERNDE